MKQWLCAEKLNKFDTKNETQMNESVRLRLPLNIKLKKQNDDERVDDDDDERVEDATH